MSVVVPVRDGAAYVARSVPPLVAAGGQGVLEVLVVDDGSRDASADVAREQGARVIASRRPAGPASARNLAAREARGDILLFVDADVVVHDDAVSRLVDAFADASTVAVFGSYDDRPDHRGFASLYMNLRHHHVHQQASDDAETFWAGLGAVRRRAFVDVGGFDAGRFGVPSVEDIDLGRRLRAAGGRIRRVPEIRGTHLKRWTWREVIATDVCRRGLPWARLMLEYPGAFTSLNVGTGERWKAALALALAASVACAIAGVAPLWLPAVLGATAALVSRKLLMVFARAGGWWMAVRGILFHQLYYLYAAATYAAALLGHRTRATR